MSKLFVFVAALLFVQLASCNVLKREAPATPGTAPTLSEIAEKAEVALKQANDDILRFLGFENNEQLVEKVKLETKTFAESAKKQFDEISKQVNSEKTTEFVESLRKQVDELTKENPAITADVKALNEQFQTSLQKIVKEAQKFGQKLQVEGKELGADTEKLVKTFVDSTVEAGKKVTDAVKQTQQ